MPGDVATALQDAGLTESWEAMRPAARRRALQPVEDAAREETRARRITRMIADLRS
ncbi:YdeI/OmpD-associated family protein [Serinicoccus kebangsaanensis]|uniref:YdeI/OmpD-associated family protein n=1 Tax=Serinicoccus kebangsaanensis TaxID=2602069 RepID=UPI00178C4929|nr:YdeI/OmpD-associated family protein [Serinicoccus kebangsaanensis]